jgi:ABC-type Fe3+-hydroxamate transport system substrate-binding protein
VRELTDGRHVPGHVGSVLIGERVVIHERPEGRIVALDEAATAIWLHLGGWSANDSLDLAGPVVADFVRQLVALGFVSPEVLR